MSLSIGIDVGGTKIAAGLVDEAGKVLREEYCHTPAEEASATVEAIIKMVQLLSADADVETVGIGAAGFCDAKRSQVTYAPNLAWRNEPLKADIESATGLKTVVENDANAAAWGEFRFGAARHASSALVVTLGTGIGGGIIMDDRLIRGFQGFAAEIGHMQIKEGGRRCGCGLRGCWERYGSGTALVHEAKELASVAPVNAKRLLEMAGGDVEAITGPMVTKAAAEGDPAAIEVVETIARWVGIGIADLCAILDPEVIVLAGGVASTGEMLLNPVIDAYEKNLTGRHYREVAEIRLAELGVPAGMIGAADLAREPQAN